MRGTFVDQGGLFSYIAPEARVPVNHPLRKIRELVRDVLGELTHSLGRLYASEGRPSIPPEQLLSALLLQVFYGIRCPHPPASGAHQGRSDDPRQGIGGLRRRRSGDRTPSQRAR